MKLTWKAFKKSWLEVSLIVIVLIFAGILAIYKPFNPDTIGYFADVSTVALILLAVLLVIVGARRSVV